MSATMRLRTVWYASPSPGHYRLEALSGDDGENATRDTFTSAPDLTSGGTFALPNVAQRLADNSNDGIVYEADEHDPFDI